MRPKMIRTLVISSGLIVAVLSPAMAQGVGKWGADDLRKALSDHLMLSDGLAPGFTLPGVVLGQTVGGFHDSESLEGHAKAGFVHQM